MHPDVLELVAVQPQPADQENPHVVFRAFAAEGPAILAGGAFRGQGLCCQGQEKDDVCFDLTGVRAAVGGPNFDGPHSPDVVQVQIAVSVAFVVAGVHIQLTEPGLVQAFVGDLAGGAQAVDEVPIGALRVVAQPVFSGSQGFEDQLFLLIKDLGEVGDLSRAESLCADVDVLAGFAGGFRTGFAQGSDHFLQRFHIFPAEDRGHHFAAAACAQGTVADCFPDPAVRGFDLPGIVAQVGPVGDRSADHALDRFCCHRAGDASVFKLGSEGQAFHGFDCVLHFCISLILFVLCVLFCFCAYIIMEVRISQSKCKELLK